MIKELHHSIDPIEAVKHLIQQGLKAEKKHKQTKNNTRPNRKGNAKL
jgi:hypothetical protein